MAKRKMKAQVIVIEPVKQRDIGPGDILHAATQVGRAIDAFRDAAEAVKPIIRHALRKKTR